MNFGRKKSQELTQEQQQRDRIVIYKRVFGSQDGKAVLYDILNRSFVLSTHKGDPFSEGKRSLALDILHHCNINMAEFDKILKGDSE